VLATARRAEARRAKAGRGGRIRTCHNLLKILITVLTIRVSGATHPGQTAVDILTVFETVIHVVVTIARGPVQRQLFPGMAQQSRAEQKRRGLETIATWMNNKELLADPQTEPRDLA